MINPREGAWNHPYAIWHNGDEWFFKRHDRFSEWLMVNDVRDIMCCMENRLAAFNGTRKWKKLESFQLSKPSELYSLYLLIQATQFTNLTKIAETEENSKKKIQQILKSRLERDSNIPYFITRYQHLLPCLQKFSLTN